MGSDIDNIIADRRKDEKQASTRKNLGASAATQSGELGDFLELGPDIQQLHDYIDAIPGLTDSQRDHLLKMRSAHIKAGVSIEEANLRMQSQLAADIHLAEQKRVQDKAHADAAEDQNRAGSLTRRLEAIKTHGTHTIMMHSGCATRARRNDFAFRAVNQC